MSLSVLIGRICVSNGNNKTDRRAALYSRTRFYHSSWFFSNTQYNERRCTTQWSPETSWYASESDTYLRRKSMRLIATYPPISAIKKLTLFLADNGPVRDEISKLDQLCAGESRSSDGPIEDPRRLDRIGPFCGAVERPALSVLSTFGHASMMSTGIAWTASGRSLEFGSRSRSSPLSHLSRSLRISSLHRCTVSLITNCLRELPLATLGSSSEGTLSRLPRLVTTTSGSRFPLCPSSRF